MHNFMLLIVYTCALTDPKLRCTTYKRMEKVGGGGTPGGGGVIANNNDSPSFFVFV